MRKKFVLFFTDDQIIHYNGLTYTAYDLAKGIEAVQDELRSSLSLAPVTPLSFMIDRNHQDIREEQLPPLMSWDKLFLLRHKKEEWASQGKFYGYQLFKQDGKSFLQWVNIPHKDWLVPWLVWAQSLENPLEGVFFVSLEAGRFLKKHFPSFEHYQMLIYRIGSHKARYIIFKGQRLLLSRSFIGEEDFRTSLHFLSRLYPDVHEKLQILSLINDAALSDSYETASSDLQTFMNFLVSHKKETLSLKLGSAEQYQWIRRGVGGILIGFLVFSGLTIYQSLEYEREIKVVLSEIEGLNNQIQLKKGLLKNKDIVLLRRALEHYHQINSQRHSPDETMEKLVPVLREHHLRLQSFIWRNEQSVEVEIYFAMQNNTGVLLSDQFGSLLSSLRDIFPHSNVQVIEAPFKSGSHETFDYPTTLSPPMARLRIVG